MISTPVIKKNLEERLLGIDVGDTNIGLAFGASGLTSSLAVLNGKNLETAFNQILRYVLENKIDKVVVGLPLLPDGKPSSQTIKVRSFVKRLKIRVKKPIILVNEFLSSKEALKAASGYFGSAAKKHKVDSLAAEVILRRYYEEGVK